MSDRESQRRGRSQSVGGTAADAALDDLVTQFADPWSFVRELVQNSLDAGSVEIGVRVRYQDGVASVEVVDDGEGMDRATIEGYLVTLFRSTKDQDLTKIGKFGIGFVSVFAIEPDAVVVDTGRDGTWLRLSFDADRTWTLTKQPDPFEGTTVSVRKRVDRATARDFADKALTAAKRWCRFAEADIRFSTVGLGKDADPAPIRAPFTVDSPVTVTLEEDAVEAVLGVHPGPRSRATFLNRGLLLWEGDTDLVPGVTFLVKGRHLEHTLTRDDVKRDRHFRHIVDRVAAAAATALPEAFFAALAAATQDGDADRCHALCALLPSSSAWSWPKARGLWPAVDRAPVSLADLDDRRGLRRYLGSAPPVLFGDPDDPLAVAVARSGRVVVAARDGKRAHAERAAALIDTRCAAVYRHFTLTESVAPPAWLAEVVALANAATASHDAPHRLTPAKLHGVLSGKLAVARTVADGIEERAQGQVTPGPLLAFDASHDLVTSLAGLPRGAAALLLLRAALSDSGHEVPPDEALFLDLGRQR